MFRQADTEESGTVPASVVPSLAGKVLGTNAKESDLQLIQFWVEQKEGECVCFLGCCHGDWVGVTKLTNRRTIFLYISMILPFLPSPLPHSFSPLSSSPLNKETVQCLSLSF